MVYTRKPEPIDALRAVFAFQILPDVVHEMRIACFKGRRAEGLDLHLRDLDGVGFGDFFFSNAKLLRIVGFVLHLNTAIAVGLGHQAQHLIHAIDRRLTIHYRVIDGRRLWQPRPGTPPLPDSGSAARLLK